MSEATPGPWERSPEGYRVFAYLSGDIHVVAYCALNNRERTARAQADAALIAAAPDLLAALKEAKEAAYELHGLTPCPQCPTTYEKGDLCPMLKRVDEAIVKAEGR